MEIVLYSKPSSRVFLPDLSESWLVKREDFVGGYPVYSGLLVCPLCKEIWCRLSMEGCEFHEARNAPCAQHPDACHPDLRPVAGSLLDNLTINGYDTALLQALPEALLRREFDLTLRSFNE